MSCCGGGAEMCTCSKCGASYPDGAACCPMCGQICNKDQKQCVCGKSDGACQCPTKKDEQCGDNACAPKDGGGCCKE